MRTPLTRIQATTLRPRARGRYRTRVRHYSEADLLETYYTPPGESLSVMLHLADCSDCAARYERLDAKMRSLGACAHERPHTFWARARQLIVRGLRRKRHE